MFIRSGGLAVVMSLVSALLWTWWFMSWPTGDAAFDVGSMVFILFTTADCLLFFLRQAANR